MGALLTKLRQMNLATPVTYKELPIHRLFESQLEHHSEKPALTYLDIEQGIPVTVSYRYLNKASNKCARVLMKILTEKSDRTTDNTKTIIATCMQPSLFFAIIHLAIWKAGAACLTIDPNDEHIEQIQHYYNAEFLIYDENADASYPFNENDAYDAQTLIRSSYQENSFNIGKEEMLCEESLNALAAIMFTSANTTGQRKGVLLSHKSLLNRMFWQWHRFPYKSNEHTALFQTAITCVESIYELWCPLICGLTVLVLSRDCRNQPLLLLNILEEYRIQRITLMPNLLTSLVFYLNHNLEMSKKGRRKRHLKNVKHWFCTGEQLPQLTILKFYDYFNQKQKLYSFYGCTELSGDVMYFNCNRDRALELITVPLGKPIANTQIYLLNKKMNQVQNGEVGELCVSGSCLALGYIDEYQMKDFMENPYSKNTNFSRLFRTGDLCRKLDGNILYIGRKESQIEYNGENINLTTIEQCCSNFPLVKKSIVVFNSYDQELPKILAFVKFQPNCTVEARDYLYEEIRKVVPTSLNFDVVMLTKFPTLINGKIDRYSLFKCYKQVDHSRPSSILGVNTCEMNAEICIIYKEFVAIISEELNRTRDNEKFLINMEMNFFDEGGTQLNAVKIVSKLRNMGYEISLLDFITAKTIGEIFKRITNKTTNQSRVDNYIKAFPDLHMIVVRLQESNKIKMIRLIADMTVQTGDIQNILVNEKGSVEYRNLLNDFWQYMKEFSFVVLDDSNENILGVSINVCGSTLPNTGAQGALEVLIGFYEFLMEPLRTAYLLQINSKILFSLFMTTSASLEPRSNIAVINVMESEKMRLAVENNYANLLWINTDPLMQVMSCDIFYYKILLDYQINRYNSEQQFANAPESDRVLITWKVIGSNQIN